MKAKVTGFGEVKDKYLEYNYLKGLSSLYNVDSGLSIQYSC